jgi:hypothetical protein
MSKQQAVKDPEEAYFPLRGALDLVTPPYQINPGRMLDCFRYEVKPSGGYGPIDGYERVDGHGLPSEAVFQYLEFLDPAEEIVAGTIITGATSLAVGVSLVSGMVDFTGDGLLESMAGKGVFLLESGQFIDGENVTVSGVVVAAIVTAFTPNTETVDSHELYYHWLAVEARRALIQKVPGSGPVRGVWRFNGVLYAFRDNEAGTFGFMYKEDPVTGWALVTTPALAAGGSYRFENTNFGGSASTIKMYGCDGKNKAFEYDGATFNQITTGMAVDKPILICEHKKHLFLGFPNGSLQHSPPTQPRGAWSVVINAGELGMGEELHDAMSLPGGVLGIWCKDSIAILSGTGVGSWVLADHSKRSGGVKGTVQDVGKIIFLNNAGLADLSATNAFGSFKSGTVSAAVQPLLNQRRKNIPCGSVSVTGKNQYRIFFEDGYFITATFGSKGAEFTQGHYDAVVRCISAPTRADDKLGNIYFGSDYGYVYKMDSGVSLDHEPMMAYFRTPYATQKTPRIKKRYREIVVELDSFGGKQLSLQFCPDFSLNDPDIPQHQVIDVSELTGNAGIWDVSDWNSFNWDNGSGSAGGGGTASGRIDGVATEMGLMMYFNAKNTVTPLHVLNGVFTYFNFLGRKR